MTCPLGPNDTRAGTPWGPEPRVWSRGGPETRQAQDAAVLASARQTARAGGGQGSTEAEDACPAQHPSSRKPAELVVPAERWHQHCMAPAAAPGGAPELMPRAPAPPAHVHSGSRNRCLLSVACSQGLCWTWPPVLGTRGPQNPPQQGQARVPCGLVQPRPLLPGLGDPSRSASPPTSAVEGSRAGPERGAPSSVQSPCSRGSALGPLRGGTGLGAAVPEGGEASHPQVLWPALVLRQPLSPLLLGERAAAGVLGWRRALQQQLRLCRGTVVSRGQGPAAPTPGHN